MLINIRKKSYLLRLTVFITVILYSTLSPSNLFAQKELSTLTLKNTKIIDAVKAIEKVSDYKFVYSNNEINVNKVISVDTKNKSNQAIIKEIFSSYIVDFRDNTVLVKLKLEPKERPTEKAPMRKVVGTIVDASNNEPIIGVNIWIKESARGGVSDLNGHFSLDISGNSTVLILSYLGYDNDEIEVGKSTDLGIIKLRQTTKALEEVVVVGYGTQKKESVVGAISSIDVQKMRTPSSSISTMLAGQLSGIVSMTRSGEPGRSGAAEFYIRGISSFRGATKPLVLVDGIERELDLVDTDDIQSFSILKDAAASAVYGVRGANGVIIITTKKGKVSKPAINVRTEFGFTSPTKLAKFVNSSEWAELYNEASQTEYYSKDVIEKYKNGTDPDLYPNVNWMKELYKDMADSKRVSINFNGGSDLVKYYVSGTYYNESSILKNAGNIYGYNSSIRYDKFNFRANVDLSLTKSTTLNLNLANIYEKSFGPGRDKADIWLYSFFTSPNAFPVSYSDGTISAPSAASGYNPWNLLVHSGYREQFWNSSQSLVGLTQDIGAVSPFFKGLTANVKFSWDAFNSTLQIRDKNITQYHATGRDENGKLIFGNPIYQGDNSLGYGLSLFGTMTTYVEASLNYNRLFNDVHRIGGLLLYNHNIKTNTQASSQILSLPYKHQGLAGRITYAFNDKYFAEFNMGYNGSENFARGHRFGFFPAVAVGYMVSNEAWFEPLKKTVDVLKLKASHGIVGNDDIGGDRRWMYESSIKDGGSWKYGQAGGSGGTGLIVGEVENLNMSWEEAKKTNIGFELSLFRKIKLQADYFYEHRTGIFLQRSGLPAIVGLSTIPYTNVGETMNQGVDATLEYEQKVGDVFLTARGNFTYNRNKLLNNDEPDWQYKYQNRIGKPFGSGTDNYQPLGLVATGLFKSQEEIDNSPTQSFGEYRIGDIKYQDVNGDGKIDTYDRIAIGYTNIPEIVYGFGATAQWKGFDVNLFFQGISHITFFINGTSMYPFSSGNMDRSGIIADIYNNVWKTTNTVEQNANAIYPRMSLSGAAGSSNNTQTSTWNMRDGSFLRLKNMEIGYTIPKSILNKTFIRSLRVYSSAVNLLTFSKFKLWDPEFGGGAGYGYPPNKIISLGLTANF